MSPTKFGSLCGSLWGTQTERTHAGSSFVDNEQRCSQAIFDALSNGVTVCDATLPEQPLIYVNRAFEAMTGYSADESCGRNCRFLQGADRNQVGLSELRAAINERRSTSVLLRNFRKDGTLFWNQLHLSPIVDSSGQLALFVGIQDDVTAKVQADILHAQYSRSQRESQARYQAVFDSMSDGLIVFDTNENLLTANSAATRLFGFNARTLSYQQAASAFEVYLPNGDVVPR